MSRPFKFILLISCACIVGLLLAGTSYLVQQNPASATSAAGGVAHGCPITGCAADYSPGKTYGWPWHYYSNPDIFTADGLTAESNMNYMAFAADFVLYTAISLTAGYAVIRFTHQTKPKGKKK